MKCLKCHRKSFQPITEGSKYCTKKILFLKTQKTLISKPKVTLMQDNVWTLDWKQNWPIPTIIWSRRDKPHKLTTAQITQGNNRTSTHGNNYSMLYNPKYSVVVWRLTIRSVQRHSLQLATATHDWCADIYKNKNQFTCILTMQISITTAQSTNISKLAIT